MGSYSSVLLDSGKHDVRKKFSSKSSKIRSLSPRACRWPRGIAGLIRRCGNGEALGELGRVKFPGSKKRSYLGYKQRAMENNKKTWNLGAFSDCDRAVG